MTLPLFHVPPAALAGLRAGGTVELDGAEGHHAATVRRVAVGDRVLVADGQGTRAVATVQEVGSGRVLLGVDEVTAEPEPSPRFVLVQALAKGGRDEAAIEAATEIGVDRVVPWQAARSIVRWRGSRGERSRLKWVATVEAAAKQSRRARTPTVTPVVTTGQLADLVRDAAAAYVLHEEADRPLAGTGLPDAGDVLLVVGPEGGITPEEVHALERAGASAVRLGRSVLRASTAGPAALAVLSAGGRWR